MFLNRADAAHRLATELCDYRNRKDTLVLAIPRGGLAVGNTLARELHLPLDIILTKKIGHPGNPEYAIGSVSLAGEDINLKILERDSIPQKYIQNEILRIRKALLAKYRMYKGDQKPTDLAGKTVIISDDGVATGMTLFAAIQLARAQGPKSIIVAIPVAPPETLRLLSAKADGVFCLEVGRDFMSIGQFYNDFSPIEDEEAILFLRQAQERLNKPLTGHSSSRLL